DRQRQAVQAGDESMVKTFCKSGESEAVKGAVHALGGVLAASMAAYNIAAWCYRRETHLGINAIVYTLAIVWTAARRPDRRLHERPEHALRPEKRRALIRIRDSSGRPRTPADARPFVVTPSGTTHRRDGGRGRGHRVARRLTST